MESSNTDSSSIEQQRDRKRKKLSFCQRKLSSSSLKHLEQSSSISKSNSLTSRSSCEQTAASTNVSTATTAIVGAAVEGKARTPVIDPEKFLNERYIFYFLL